MDKKCRKTLTSDDKVAQNPDRKNPNNLKPPDSLEQSVRWLDSDGMRLYEALNFIKASVTKGANEIVRFRHLKGIDKLTEIIPNINPKFLGQILSILTTCCVEEKSCYKFAQCDGVKVVDEAVLKMLATDSLRIRFCRLIAKLAAHDSCRILIHDRPELVKSIVGFLAEEATNECKLAVCKAIRVLSNSDSDQDVILRWQVLKEVATLLKGDNDDVIMQSLGTVSQYLKRCTDECVRQLISAETIQSLCTLSSRKEHPDIAKYSMSILLKIPLIRNLRPFLGFNNAVELFVRSAEAFMSSDMATMRTKDLRQLYHLVNSLCLCCRDPANRIKMKEVGGVGLLVRVLKTEQLAQIHDRAISSLVCFNYYVEGLEMLCNAEVFDVLVAHLYRCMRKVSGEKIQSAVSDESLDVGLDKLWTHEAAEFDDLGEVKTFSPLDVEGCVSGTNFTDSTVDTAADMPTAAADEEVNAITEARHLEFGRENHLPRYSIHSPTYKAVISEMKFDNDAEHNPRNMWEGIELYGNVSSTKAPSPSSGSSPCRPCSTISSSPRNSYSPMSLSSCTNSESMSEFGSPESELGLDENRGWSPCISGSDESRQSPLQDQADISLSTWSPISVNCDPIGRLDNSPSVPLSQEKRTLSTSVSGITSENDLVQPCRSESLKEDEVVEQSDDDDESLLMFSSESFRKQRHFAQMLERYEGAFQSCITPPASEGQSNKGEKRKRSLSLQTLSKIQKTVEGDIKRNAESCLGLDKMVSRTSSLSGLSETPAPCRTRCLMSSERITMINILNLFWRALDLGNSNVTLCSRRIVRAILDYVDYVSPPSRRASKLLLRLSQNLLSFEMLLKNGVPSLFHEVLVLGSSTGSLGDVRDADNKDDDISCTAGDGETSTDFCLRFDDDDYRNEPSTCQDSNLNEGRVQAFAKQKATLYENLICNLSIVAQTPFGEGIVIGILKRGKQVEKDRCMVELCYIAKSDAMKKQYLLKLGGLKLLREMLSNTDSCLFLRALRSVCYIANQLQIGSISRNNLGLSDEGEVSGVPGEVIPTNDISFMLENGDLVFANRTKMASSSEVFRALLEGHFAESTMSSIPILRASTRAFQFLVRLIHDESLADCIKSLSCENSNAVCEVLFEVLRLGNQYLMSDACEQVGKYICREFLTEDNTEEVFNMCVTLNCRAVILHCLAYIFCGISSHKKMQQLVKKLLTGTWRREFLSAVSSSLEDALSSS